MLRTKFWTGLSNQSLKNSTRHLFDTIKDFQHLLRDMRKVELAVQCHSHSNHWQAEEVIDVSTNSPSTKEEEKKSFFSAV